MGTERDSIRRGGSDTPALRLYEERLKALLELSSEWYWEQDEHYRFTRITGAARKSGVRPERLCRDGAPGPWRMAGRGRRQVGQAQGYARSETTLYRFRFQARQFER